jgi:alpha-L-fucosidase
MRILTFILSVVLLSTCTTGPGDRETKDIPRPTEAQVAWQDCEVGVLFCLDMPVLAGDYSPNNSSREVFDPKLYNPKKLDTDQWIQAAKDAGAKYAIFTATHFNGFMQWQSDLYPYGLKQAAWCDGKGDIAADFVESCRKAGIKPGFFFSVHRNAYWKVWGHYVDWGEGKGTPEQEDFNRVAEKMAEELWSRYGPHIQCWFDVGTKLPHEGGPDMLPVFDKYQPNSVFYHSSLRSEHRWVGNEDGYANYPCWATTGGRPTQLGLKGNELYKYLATGDPDGSVWAPAMVDIPLRGAKGIHNWFWNPGQDSAVYTPDALVDMYYESVGRNSNFIIGAVIDTNGLVPEADCKSLKAFGNGIRRIFAEPIAEADGKGNELMLKLSPEQPVNHIVIAEDIRQGERVRKYTLEALSGGQWEQIAEGSCIGHKRIHKLETFSAEKIRLTISEATVKPIIKSLSAYHAAPGGRDAVPEFSGKSFSYQELAGLNEDGSRGIGFQEGMTRRDPSDVIKVDDTWYVWYTRVTHADVAHNEYRLRASGYVGTLWYATSRDEGHTWVEQGEVLGVGKEGAFDAQAVFTCNILKFKEKYYLYYDAVKPTPGGSDHLFENNSTNDFTNMGVAVADSPDGPWTRVSEEPILRYNPDGKSFDSYRVDDSSLILRDGKIWLYYKGRNLQDGPHGPRYTMMGVAFADKPEGPYTRYEGNPILEKSHEVLVWSHREGVAAYASFSKSLEYAPDGLDFNSNPVEMVCLPKPIAPGAFRPELTEPVSYGNGIKWGISMLDPGGQPHLIRWECDLSVN